MPDRIEKIEADIVAVYGSMLEVEWDGIDGVVCRLAGKKIASATSIAGLAIALDKWAAATGLKQSAARRQDEWVTRPHLEWADDSAHINELFASRGF